VSGNIDSSTDSPDIEVQTLNDVAADSQSTQDDETWPHRRSDPYWVSDWSVLAGSVENSIPPTRPPGRCDPKVH
jgi:hypothetical protein